jgi:hypothetical protein
MPYDSQQARASARLSSPAAGTAWPRRRALGLLAALALAALLPAVQAPAPAAAQYQDAPLELLGVTWDHAAITYSLQTEGDVPLRALNEVRAAIREWDARFTQLGGGYRNLRLVPASGTSADIPITVRAQRPAAGVGHPSPAIQASGCWLLQAPIVIAALDERGMALADDAVFAVAAHELGHALGLGHARDSDDLMYSRYADSRRRPSALDLRGLRAVFAWLDGSQGATSTPRCPRVRSVN